jgi:hypothetical protein
MRQNICRKNESSMPIRLQKMTLLKEDDSPRERTNE